MWWWWVACAEPARLPVDPDSETAVAPGVLPDLGVAVPLGGRASFGLADVAVTPDGGVWVAWVGEDPSVPNGRDVLVARSTDGRTFEGPVAIDGSLEPAATWPRIPRLAVAADGGLLLAFASERGATETVHVFRASPGNMDFTQIFERERTLADNAVELLLPLARSGPTGATWVAWVTARGLTAELWAAREEDGWVEKRVDGGDAEPACTCCPIDFAVSGDRASFLWRGGARRELVVSEATPEGYGPPLEISNFGLVFLACPLDGPVLLGDASGFRVIASDTDPGEAALWSLVESAPGLWLPPVPLPGDAGGGTKPSVAVDGAVTWLAFEGDDAAWLARGVNDAWEPNQLVADETALAEPTRLASGAGKTVSVRVATDRSLWLASIDEAAQ